jgi:hypothetical protein
MLYGGTSRWTLPDGTSRMNERILPALSASEGPEQDRYSPETVGRREAGASDVFLRGAR